MDNDRRIRPAAYPGEDQCTSLNAAVALLLVMKALSREAFGVPWSPHLEKKLWEEMKTPKRISPLEAKSLHYLFEKAHGWWSWTSSSMPGPSFIPKAIWLDAMGDEE